MGKILTISIAAYNVEKYLDQTLSSLYDSRFLDDIEVLIIDDGSKDRTRDIAIQYQDKAPQTFRYIGKENGGHGSTINKGIELASGKYFRVIDGDDWVDTDKFAIYIEKLKYIDTDMVVTQHRAVTDNRERLVSLISNVESERVLSWKEAAGIEQITIHMMSIKTELLKKSKIHITEKCFYVDIEYTIWGLFLANSILYLEIPVYMYRRNNEAQSTNKKNMVRNVNMQELVSYNVVSLYNQFLQSADFCGTKKDIITRRISQIVGSTERTLLLVDNAVESRERIVKFDKQVKALSQDIYHQQSKELFFKVLRFNNYMFIPVLRSIYRIWIMKY